MVRHCGFLAADSCPAPPGPVGFQEQACQRPGLGPSVPEGAPALDSVQARGSGGAHTGNLGHTIPQTAPPPSRGLDAHPVQPCPGVAGVRGMPAHSEPVRSCRGSGSPRVRWGALQHRLCSPGKEGPFTQSVRASWGRGSGRFGQGAQSHDPSTRPPRRVGGASVGLWGQLRHSGEALSSKPEPQSCLDGSPERAGALEAPLAQRPSVGLTGVSSLTPARQGLPPGVSCCDHVIRRPPASEASPPCREQGPGLEGTVFPDGRGAFVGSVGTNLVIRRFTQHM